MAFTLSDDDKAFIAEISARFPDRKIGQKFNDYLAHDPKFRPKIAEFGINFVPRNGWSRVGIPGLAQTVRDHMNALDEMIALAPPHIDRERVRKMLAKHDMGEVIISDFTPYDDITSAEKKRLERLAVYVIYEEYPEDIALWEEYEEANTEDARHGHDYDILEPIFHAEILREQHPARTDSLKEFWNGMEKALRTENGKTIFATLQATQEKAGIISKYQRIAQVRRDMNGPQ